MSERLLIDTDVLIDFLRGQPDALAYLVPSAGAATFSSLIRHACHWLAADAGSADRTPCPIGCSERPLS